MSLFDVFRFMFGDGPAEEKLAILRPEAWRLVVLIEGNLALMLHFLEKEPLLQDTSDLLDSCRAAIEKTEELEHLIEALTAPDYRDRLGLPELRPYDSLLDAIKQTARDLNMPLAKAIEDKSQLHIHSRYPLTIWDSPAPKRGASLELLPSCYQVELREYKDNNWLELEVELGPKALSEAATFFQNWLLDNLSADSITQTVST